MQGNQGAQALKMCMLGFERVTPSLRQEHFDHDNTTIFASVFVAEYKNFKVHTELAL